MIVKIVFCVIVYILCILLIMIIRKRMFIKSIRTSINNMHNKGDIDVKTKDAFEILLKYWEDKTKWYNKIF